MLHDVAPLISHASGGRPRDLKMCEARGGSPNSDVMARRDPNSVQHPNQTHGSRACPAFTMRPVGGHSMHPICAQRTLPDTGSKPRNEKVSCSLLRRAAAHTQLLKPPPVEIKAARWLRFVSSPYIEIGSFGSARDLHAKIQFDGLEPTATDQPQNRIGPRLAWPIRSFNDATVRMHSVFLTERRRSPPRGLTGFAPLLDGHPADSMGNMPEPGGRGIFISYRRQDSSHLAGRLSDRLVDRFGEGQVFIDVDTIEPGAEFATEIRNAVASCKLLIVIISPNWLAAADARGVPRLANPDDIVRLEIEAALAREIRVIPILMEGAVMPARQDLPDTLADLAGRNALPVRHETFRSDAARLIAVVERVLTAPLGAGVNAKIVPTTETSAMTVGGISDVVPIHPAADERADPTAMNGIVEALGDRNTPIGPGVLVKLRGRQEYDEAKELYDAGVLTRKEFAQVLAKLAGGLLAAGTITQEEYEQVRSRTWP